MDIIFIKVYVDFDDHQINPLLSSRLCLLKNVGETSCVSPDMLLEK